MGRIIYFFGRSLGGTEGHYLYGPGYRMVRDGVTTPWASPDGRELVADMPASPNPYPGRPLAEREPEGRPWFERRDGWTLMGLWDRSGDPRGGSHVRFVVNEDLDDAAMLALMRSTFALLFARIERHLGREVRCG